MHSVTKRCGRRENHTRTLREVGFSVLIAALLLTVYLIVSVLLVQENTLQFNQLPIVSKLGLFFSVLVGALICARRVRHSKLICAMGTGAGIGLAVTIIGLTAGEGNAISLWPAALILCGAAILGGLLGARQKRRGYM